MKDWKDVVVEFGGSRRLVDEKQEGELGFPRLPKAMAEEILKLRQLVKKYDPTFMCDHDFVDQPVVTIVLADKSHPTVKVCSKCDALHEEFWNAVFKEW